MLIKYPPYQKPSRLKSYVTTEQIEKDCNEFLNKIGDILFSGDKYNEKAIAFARSILDFLLDWDFVTWKQYDSLMSIREQGKFPYVVMSKQQDKSGYYYINVVSNYINVKSKSVSFTCPKTELLMYEIKGAKTDKDFDSLHEKIFGHKPIFDEELNEGFSVSYDKDGNRFFSLPTGDEMLHNYI